MGGENSYWYIDGVRQESLPLDDRGLAYGHGLFESMCYHNGALPLLPQHLRRLLSGAGCLRLALDSARVQLVLEAVLKDLRQHQVHSGVIKLMVTAGSGGSGYSGRGAGPARLICLFMPRPAREVTAVKLWDCDYRLPVNPRLAGCKHLNRLDQVLARAEWCDDSYFDGLVLGDDGLVAECTLANIFFYDGNTWRTPSLDNYGVAGVMRALLLDEILPELAVPAEICRISPAQLPQFCEVFICNAVRGVIPVSALRNTAEWGVGSAVKMVQSALADKYPCFA